MSVFWRISFLFFFYGFLAQNCPKWPIPPKGKIFWVGANGKVIAPGVLVICPVDKNRDSQTKNWLLAQNIHFFWHGLHIFVPSGQLEPQYQHFQHERGVPDMRVPRVLLPPPQKWIFGPKTAKFGQKLVYLTKYFFWPKWSHAQQNNNANEVIFRNVGTT